MDRTQNPLMISHALRGVGEARDVTGGLGERKRRGRGEGEKGGGQEREGGEGRRRGEEGEGGIRKEGEKKRTEGTVCLFLNLRCPLPWGGFYLPLFVDLLPLGGGMVLSSPPLFVDSPLGGGRSRRGEEKHR